MSERRMLPEPATQADFYLYDMAVSLRAIVDALQVASAVPAGDLVELREPEPVKAETKQPVKRKV
jgi:hypothetical protein